MRKFQNIQVWQKSHDVTMRVYAFTRNFPFDERYGLTAQMRRSAAAIPTNIAEGSGKRSEKDFARFLEISFCSASELEYQVFLSWKLGYLTDGEYEQAASELSEVQRMLNGFIRRLRRDIDETNWPESPANR
jgi:four helix bundle protein